MKKFEGPISYNTLHSLGNNRKLKLGFKYERSDDGKLEFTHSTIGIVKDK